MKIVPFLCFLSVRVFADLIIMSNTIPDLVSPPPWRPDTMASTVLFDTVNRFEKLAKDSFFSRMTGEPFLYDFQDSVKSDFTRAFTHSLRTIVSNVRLWDIGVNQVSSTLSGSIGSPEQDVINPSSTTPYYYGQSWWKKVSDSNALLFGLRPFSDNPYAYLTTNVRVNGERIAMLNLRYYYAKLNFSKVEGVMVFPIDDGLRFNMGLLYSAKDEYGENNRGITGTFRLEWWNKAGFFFLGAHESFRKDSRGDTSRVQIGFTRLL